MMIQSQTPAPKPTCRNCVHMPEPVQACPRMGYPPTCPETYYCIHWTPTAYDPASLWRAFKLARLAYQARRVSGHWTDEETTNLKDRAIYAYRRWTSSAGRTRTPDNLFRLPDVDYRRRSRNYEATALDILPGQYLRYYGPGSMGHQVLSVERTCSCANLLCRPIDPETGDPLHRLVIIVRTADCDATMEPSTPVTLTNQRY